jgi:hypothetical protein
MKAYGGVDVQIHIFLTLALVGGEWSASRPCRYTSGEWAPGTIGLVGPRAGLDNVEKRKFLILLELELWPLGRPARSQSLYRLRVSRLVNIACNMIIGSVKNLAVSLLLTGLKQVRG